MKKIHFFGQIKNFSEPKMAKKMQKLAKKWAKIVLFIAWVGVGGLRWVWYGGSSGDSLGWFWVVLGHHSGSRGTAGGAEGVMAEFARCWLRQHILDTWLKTLFWPFPRALAGCKIVILNSKTLICALKQPQTPPNTPRGVATTTHDHPVTIHCYMCNFGFWGILGYVTHTWTPAQKGVSQDEK